MTNDDATCTRCDRPARGNVPAAAAYPAHYCRQCDEHCEMAAYLRERAHTKVWGSDDASGPAQKDVDALRELLDLMVNFPSNDQRARYILSSNWLRDYRA